MLRTVGSRFRLSPKGRKSSAQLGAPKFDKFVDFVEFVASGYMTCPLKELASERLLPPALRHCC